MKKSQAAMEFLFTYGWAILVIIVVMGLLAYFGVLGNPSKRYCQADGNIWLEGECISTTGITCREIGGIWNQSDNICLSEIELLSNKVCSNLDKNGSVFYMVISQRSNLQNIFNLNMINIDASNSKPLFFDEDGVMCSMLTTMCDASYNYCYDINMIVPVNFTQWEEFYNE